MYWLMGVLIVLVVIIWRGGMYELESKSEYIMSILKERVEAKAYNLSIKGSPLLIK